MYQSTSFVKQTGTIIGLAPNFDNNTALISRGYPSNPKSNDLLIKLFNEVLENHPEYKAYLPEIKEADVRKCVEELHMRVKKESIVQLIMNRYNRIDKQKKAVLNFSAEYGLTFYIPC